MVNLERPRTPVILTAWNYFYLDRCKFTIYSNQTTGIFEKPSFDFETLKPVESFRYVCPMIRINLISKQLCGAVYLIYPEFTVVYFLRGYQHLFYFWRTPLFSINAFGMTLYTHLKFTEQLTLHIIENFNEYNYIEKSRINKTNSLKQILDELTKYRDFAQYLPLPYMIVTYEKYETISSIQIEAIRKE